MGRERFIGPEPCFVHGLSNPIGQILERLAPVAIGPHPLGLKLIGKTSWLPQFDLERLESNRLQRLVEPWQELLANVVAQELEGQVKLVHIFHAGKPLLEFAAMVVQFRWKVDADEKSHVSMIQQKIRPSSGRLAFKGEPGLCLQPIDKHAQFGIVIHLIFHAVDKLLHLFGGGPLN